jgi:Mn2+/Fe2+ NRAMP family transporter
MKKILTTISGLVSTVGFALAQTATAPGQGLINLLNLAQNIVNRLVPILLGAGVVALFFGLVMYIWEGRSDAAKHEKWLKFIGGAILAIFVMVSIWGLVRFFGSIVGVDAVGAPNPANLVPVPSN